MPGQEASLKPAAVVYARGGAYGGEASGMDHQKPYTEQMLGFFGFSEVHPIVIEPNHRPGRSRFLSMRRDGHGRANMAAPTPPAAN